MTKVRPFHDIKSGVANSTIKNLKKKQVALPSSILFFYFFKFVNSVIGYKL
jgi:hypothetical protein